MKTKEELQDEMNIKLTNFCESINRELSDKVLTALHEAYNLGAKFGYDFRKLEEKEKE